MTIDKPLTIEITTKMNLKKIIAESREVAQALSEFACDLERIEKKYAEPQETETWNGIHAQITAPKGTFERIFNDTEYHGTEDMDGLYYCPICQQTTTVVKDGKCPKCGATMDELSTREQTEDAISRQAVLDGLASIAKAKAKSDAQKSLMGRVMFFTERLSSVKPQQKTGHWIKDDAPEIIDPSTKCSLCGGIALLHEDEGGNVVYALSDYCPHCGAKMESGEQA